MGETTKATFAAGCFWSAESVFRQIAGVVDVMVGYTGGTKEHPTYEDVCSDTTGHAEAVEITYDPGEVSYEKLLEIFWNNHNPTTPNRQPARNDSLRSRSDSGGGPDVGSQYRSAIFYHSEEQKRLAEKSKKELAASEKWKSPIATEIVLARPFYKAEKYHQRYFEKQGINPTCHI